MSTDDEYNGTKLKHHEGYGTARECASYAIGYERGHREGYKQALADVKTLFSEEVINWQKGKTTEIPQPTLKGVQ